ncbi:uncharacterized protein LOC135841149 [Planococcus citri]|uniref:uncharacterized protein LOC135841149 n=1 Tax=Planococcus citri TaxID=170843 RepID=UPI0031F7EF5A
MSNYNKPNELKLDANASENWRRFRREFDLYLKASSLINADEVRKYALLLNFAGEAAQELIDSSGMSEEDQESLELVIQFFEDRINPKVNVTFLRFKFLSRSQKEDESFEEFLAALQKLVRGCKFNDQEQSLIKDRIVIGTKDKTLQADMLKVPDLNLEEAIEMARIQESSTAQVKAINECSALLSTEKDKIDAFKNKNKYKNRSRNRRDSEYSSNRNENNRDKNDRQSDNESYRCKKCDTVHRRRECPAYGKKCSNCGYFGHFAIGCKFKNKHLRNRDKKFHTLKDNSSSDSDSTISFNAIKINKIGKKASWFENITISNDVIPFKLDCGAENNVLPYKIFKKLGIDESKIKSSSVRAVAYGNTEINMVGKIKLKSKVKNQIHNIKYLIVDVDDDPLLGLSTCEELKLIKRINKVSKADLLKEYADVFRGIGKFKEKYTLKLKKNAVPTICKLKRVPESIRKELKKTLDRYEKANIISRVNKPTEWVSNMAVAEKKSGKLRLCLFPLELNEALIQDVHPIPTSKEIIPELANKKVFTVADVSEAFFHTELDEESSELTTFITPFGKYKYNYLPQGLNISAEVHQRNIEKVFEGSHGKIIL